MQFTLLPIISKIYNIQNEKQLISKLITRMRPLCFSNLFRDVEKSLFIGEKWRICNVSLILCATTKRRSSHKFAISFPISDLIISLTISNCSSLFSSAVLKFNFNQHEQKQFLETMKLLNNLMTDVNKFPFERANFIAILFQFFFELE